MKKLISIILVLLLSFALSSCDTVPEESDTNYYCQFTYYYEDRTGGLLVNYYKTSDDSTLIEVFKPNGDIWLIDSTQIEMLCVEWDGDE